MHLVPTFHALVCPPEPLLLAVAAYEGPTSGPLRHQQQLVMVPRMHLRLRKALRLPIHFPLQHVYPPLCKRIRILFVEVDEAPPLLRHRLPVRPQDNEAGNPLYVEVFREMLNVWIAVWYGHPGHGLKVRIERDLVVVARQENYLEVVVGRFVVDLLVDGG